MMTQLVALIGLLSFCLLPGVVVVRFRLRTWLEYLGAACTISIGLNCFVVMLLCISGVYTTRVSLIWMVCLIIASLGWLIKGRTFPLSYSPREQTFNRILPWLVGPVFLIVAYKSFFLPYFSWDAVASWNRWARNFVLDPAYFESHSFFYPQYMSWGMSFPYMVTGDPSLEYYSHGFSFFLLLVLYFGVSRMARVLHLPPALPFLLLFVSVPFSAFAGSGYADIGTAGYSAVALGLSMEALKRGRDRNWRDHASSLGFFLAGLAAGTATLFKQSALLIIIPVPLLSIVGMKPSKTALRTLCKYLLGIMAVCIPWILAPTTQLSGSQLSWLTQGHHGIASRLEIVASGATILLKEITSCRYAAVDIAGLVVAGVLIVFGARRDNISALLAGGFIFALLVWVNTANYDTRGLMPAMVAGSMACIAGLDCLARHFGRRGLVFTCFGGILLLAFLFTQWYPKSVLGGKLVVDWTPGAEWKRTKAFRDRGSKLSVLMPSLGDLESWKKEFQPHLQEIKVWGEPMITASLDPWRIDGGGKWIVRLEVDAKPKWNEGEYLLVTKKLSGTQKPAFPFTDSLLVGEFATWGDWLEQATRQGVTSREAAYKNLTVYRFCIDPNGDHVSR